MSFFSEKGQEDIKLFSEKIQFPIHYDIYQTTLFQLNNVSINDTETEIVWRVDDFSKDEDGYKVKLFCEKHEVVNFDKKYENLFKMMEMFNYPTQSLELLLNKNGIPTKVINQAEIFRKWELLRDGDLAEFKEDESMSKILSGADKDFKNTFTSISDSVLYIIFFPPVFGVRKNKKSLRSISLLSQLFQPMRVEFSISEELKSYSNLDTIFIHKGNGTLEDEYNAKKIFETGYKVGLGIEKFDYKYNYRSQYKYDLSKGIISSCDAMLSEQIGERIINKQTYKINIRK